MSDSGILYVASQSLRYLCEAIASAESLRVHSPRTPLVLATDIESVTDCDVPPFDGVIALGPPDPRAVEGARWGKGLLAKVQSFSRSPFSRTLFVDSDTRIMSGDVATVFDALDVHALAAVPCTGENSRACALFGPMFNTGVVAYRDDAFTRDLFRRWEELQGVHLRLASEVPPGKSDYVRAEDDGERRFLLMNDQVSFARLVAPELAETDRRVGLLDRRWNERGGRTDSTIIHHRDEYKLRDADVEAFLGARGMIE